jgi:hypothetical protein
MEVGSTEQERWRLPAIGPEIVLRVQAAAPSGTAAVTPAEICDFLCAQDRLHQQLRGAPLASFTLEDCTIIEQSYRAAALWDRIMEARSRGALSQLKLVLDKVRLATVSASWFSIAAQAGVSEIRFDLNTRRINDVFKTLSELCTRARAAGMVPVVPLPLVGPGIDLTEASARAVVLLKGGLALEVALSDVAPDQLLDLPSQLRSAIQQGSLSANQLCDLLIDHWLQHLPPANRRALFPLWMALNPQGQEPGSFPSPEEATANLHPQLKPPFTEWLRGRTSSPA